MAKDQKTNSPVATPTTISNQLDTYVISDTAQVEDRLEAIRETLGNRKMTVSDLTTLKVPSAGSQLWTIPNPNTGEVEGKRTIEGVIIHSDLDPRRLYMTPFEATGGGTPPDCRSDDGITGVGIPGGVCHTCMYNEWGSDLPDKQGNPTKGKRCKERGVLAVVVAGEVFPVIVHVPTGSVNDVRKQLSAMVKDGTRYHQRLVTLGLKPDKNGNGLDYSQIDLRPGPKLSPADLAIIAPYRDRVKKMIEFTGATDTALLAIGGANSAPPDTDPAWQDSRE